MSCDHPSDNHGVIFFRTSWYSNAYPAIQGKYNPPRCHLWSLFPPILSGAPKEVSSVPLSIQRVEVMGNCQGTRTEKSLWDTVCPGISGAGGHWHAMFENHAIGPTAERLPPSSIQPVFVDGLAASDSRKSCQRERDRQWIKPTPAEGPYTSAP
jgi:hypothetical protein